MKINYNLLIEDATSLREEAAEFAEGKSTGKGYKQFLSGYPKEYREEGKKLFNKGIKRARIRLKSWFTRNYGNDFLD